MVKLDDVLKELGPNAAIVFASWIFMGFLQARYDNAIMRYREAIGEFRDSDQANQRAAPLKEQILMYRHRCKMMGWATLVGLLAAILLIAAILLAAVDVLVPGLEFVRLVGIASSLLGFALLIVSACLVIAEGRIVHRQLDNELRDIEDLADA